MEVVTSKSSRKQILQGRFGDLFHRTTRFKCSVESLLVKKCRAGNPWHAAEILIKAVLKPMHEKAGGVTEECEGWCEGVSAAPWNSYGM